MISYLKMLCYGKFNSFRVNTIAMQAITELYQFVFRVFSHCDVSPVNN